MSEIVENASDLAARPYIVVVFKDKTTDGDFIFLAVNPEIDGCMAQGETMEEAEENLDVVRVAYIQHLLDHGLPVPEPAWMVSSTEADSIDLENVVREDFDIERTSSSITQLKGQERPFSALLRT